MWIIDNWHKFVIVAILIVGYSVLASLATQRNQIEKTETAVTQMHDHTGKVQQAQMERHFIDNNGYAVGWAIVALFCFLVFIGDLRRMFTRMTKTSAVVIILLTLTGCGGCKKPFEPVKLEVIESHEEAFMIPLTGDDQKQESSNNEEYLRKALVFTKQVKIPQQWVPKGYETYGWDGEWRDSAKLIKVMMSPVTREWTADPNSGTSNKNEAVWVMTSDQVEFSTGWTITARIADKDAAVVFLHNYPNGSLTTVLDTEVRAKLQSEFGLAVTDLPMETLRKSATPVIIKVVKNVTEFFKPRGITITNLGITGGFVYKDKSIIDTMVKLFNAEQEQAMAVAKTKAQEEQNKAVILEATGKADAIMKTKKAEADGIKMIADARSYEVDKAKADLKTYFQLSQLELQDKLLKKWDGTLPRNFLGGGANGSGGPTMLLQVPTEAPEPAKK